MTYRFELPQFDFEQIRNLAIITLAAIILFFCATGCRVQSPIASSDTIRTTLIKEVVKDTTIYLTDSAGFRALLECDSMGQVRVKQVTDYYAGQFVKPHIVIKDNFVNVNCVIDSGAVYISWKEKYEIISEKINTVKVPPPVNYVTGWQWAQIYAGRLLIALLVLFIVFQILKRYTSLKLPF